MTRRQRGWAALAVLVTGGTVFQGVGFTRTGLGTGCNGFATNNLLLNGAVSGVDFCYLLDCRNGFFGGAVRPCDPANPANDLLVDCSPYTVTTGTSSSTNQTTNQTSQTTTNALNNLTGF